MEREEEREGLNRSKGDQTVLRFPLTSITYYFGLLILLLIVLFVWDIFISLFLWFVDLWILVF